jgi:hypothetical protein
MVDRSFSRVSLGTPGDYAHQSKSLNLVAESVCRDVFSTDTTPFVLVWGLGFARDSAVDAKKR